MKSKYLKIEGGAAAFSNGPPKWPVASEEVIAAVNDALRSGQWGNYDGQLLTQTHQRLQSLFGLKESLLCSSGTIAVELALRGCGVKPGDEVIVAGYDFPGNFRAIESVGATPVLVDVVDRGWTMDSAGLMEAIGENTRAVLVSHLHGQAAAMEEINAVVCAAENGLGSRIFIVEDLCQSPGAKRNDRLLGGFGDATTLSFGGSKLLSSGRGGAVMSNSAEIIQRIKVFAHRGNDAFPFSQIQAALLLPQLDELQTLNVRRAAAAQKIAVAVNRLSYLNTLPEGCFDQDQGHWPAFYKLPILIDADAPFDRADFLAVMKAEGIAIGEGFRGFVKRSPRRCRKIGALSKAATAADHTMVLHHPILLEQGEVIDRVIETIGRAHAYCVR